MNAVIYARYSSENQREESIEGQIRDCMEYAKRKGLTVIETYVDRARSATSDNRPDFLRMIHDSTRKQFEVVLVWKLDRFARNRYDSAKYKAFLKKSNVKVLSVRENIPEGSDGILLEAILEAMAEHFSVDLSQKVTCGMKENALKCRHNGGIPALGYTVDKDLYYHVDEAAASIVRDIFNKYDRGIPMKEIAAELNARGLHTAHGKPYNVSRIGQILSNRKYIGEYRFGENVIPNGIPALISQELFDRVQIRKGKNKHAPAHAKATENYLLSTKLSCGECGAFMVGESGTSSTGAIYRYYRCVNTKRNKTCHKKPLKKDMIEDFTIQTTYDMLQDEDLLKKLEKSLFQYHQKESSYLKQFKRNLTDVNKRIKNLMNAIEQGILTPSTKERLQELEEEKAHLEQEIATEELERSALSEDQILFFLYQFRDLDLSNENQRQHLVDVFINQIFVFDDHVKFTFNYHNGTKIVTLAEIESSNMKRSGVPKKRLFRKE